jgi:hypothetical protein
MYGAEPYLLVEANFDCSQLIVLRTENSKHFFVKLFFVLKYGGACGGAGRERGRGGGGGLN